MRYVVLLILLAGCNLNKKTALQVSYDASTQATEANRRVSELEERFRVLEGRFHVQEDLLHFMAGKIELLEKDNQALLVRVQTTENPRGKQLF